MKFSDADLIAALEGEEALAVDASQGELAKERADALDRYRGAPLGNEVEGRSQVVDRSIMDTIEWIMPSLVRIYLGGDEIGKFEPRGPEDEEGAKTETDVCNWYLEAKNDTFSQINATLRDALLLKNGYMIGLWQKKYDTMTETYIGKTDDEAVMLMQGDETRVIEHTEYPDPSGFVDPMSGKPYTLHDIKVEAKSCEEFVQVESVPSDEILVSRRHRWTSLLDCDFVEWVRRNVTIGQLRAEGFDIPDDTPGDDAMTMEANSRDRFATNPFMDRDDNTPDPSRRVVTFRDAYIRMDMDGSGMPKLWRIARVNGSKDIALKEEANIIPFAAFSPIIYPHSHIGTSIYDLIADLGIIKTTLQRQALDGIYLQNSGRVGVDVNRLTNLDDLLINRAGAVIRTDGPPSDVLMPFVSPDSSGSVLGMLEFIEGQKEGRTGVTRYSAGLDANTLNKTATGVQAIQSAANQRIELIARTLAGGFKDLFLIIHALASKHSTQALQIKLKGKWVKVDPRQWKKRTDFSISVGLGTGTPEQQLQKLLTLSPVFQQGMQMGLAGPTEAYNYGVELWKAAGYRVPDRFIHAPPMAPKMGQDGQPVMGPDGKPVMEPQMPPPQKDPMVQAEEIKSQAHMQAAQMKSQADMQIAQAKQQADAQTAQIKHQADMQIESAKMQASNAREQAQAQADMQVQQHKIQTDAQLELEKARMGLEMDAVKHSREQETAIQIALINAAAKALTTPAAPNADGTPGKPTQPDPQVAEQTLSHLAGLADQIALMAQAMGRPKTIIRGPDGRAQGIQ